MGKLILSLLGVLLALSAEAKVKTEVVEYKHDGTTLEGFIAYDSAIKGKRPAIMIVHEWTGLGDYIKGRAKELAAKGYIAFAMDIYGKGIRPTPEDAPKEAAKYRDNRKLMRDRAQAGYDFIKTKANVDPSKMVAMGYCFGGTVALEMARGGFPLAGAVSFHGALDTPTPQDANNIKTKLLILHGALDPFVKADVPAFQKEMDDAKVDYQFISYSETVHSFTNPEVGNDVSKGAAYNPVSDRRSMAHFLTFLREVVPQK